jgi:hypothetical protein
VAGFVGMTFVSAASIGGLITAYSAPPTALRDAATFTFARAFTFDIVNIYAIKMAGVVMITASTLALRTHITARWIALLGYGTAMFLLLGSGYFAWALFVFPAWALLMSSYILLDNLRGPSQIRR